MSRTPEQAIYSVTTNSFFSGEQASRIGLFVTNFGPGWSRHAQVEDFLQSRYAPGVNQFTMRALHSSGELRNARLALAEKSHSSDYNGFDAAYFDAN